MNKTHHSLLHKTIVQLTFISFALEAVLILFSWIVNATDIELGIRSLLSAEGVRWFFGYFAEGLSTPLLAWLVLLSVGCGAVNRSGLGGAVCATLKGVKIPYRSRVALFTALGAMILMSVLYLLMALLPHAVLLSVTGGLSSSPFSQSLVPAAAFIMTVAACVYGLLNGDVESLDDVFTILKHGIDKTAPLYPLYIAAMTLWQSVCYAFML